MPKFRKKPLVVEASQWHGARTGGPTPTPAGVYYTSELGFHVVNSSGRATPIEPDDWIILEPNQPDKNAVYAYRMKPDQFKAVFEADPGLAIGATLARIDAALAR